MSIENRTGSPAEKGNFYGRVKELRLAWLKIEEGNSLVLAAPRRVGKTSFSKKMLELAEQEDRKVLYLDLEGVQTEYDFVKYFTDELVRCNWIDKLADKAKSIIDSIGERIKPTVSMEGVELSLEWKVIRKDVYEKLKDLIKPEEKTLIVVDELAIFLTYLLESNKEGLKDVEFFLNWLRSFRQVKNNNIRWIFCSSIGIENFLSIHGLSNTLNDVDSFEIDELKGDEPKGLLYALGESKSIIFKDEDSSHFLSKLGWALPFYIQVLFSEIYNLKEIEEREINIDLIDDAYQKIIGKQYFNTWDERLKEYGELEFFIRLILKRLCHNKDGEMRGTLHSILYSETKDSHKADEILSRVLQILINDGYAMKKDDGKYIFRSPLLRDFWYNRFIA